MMFNDYQDYGMPHPYESCSSIHASYLLALACGNVQYQPFRQFEDKQWRTGIFPELESMDASYWELSEDTARYVVPSQSFTIRFLVPKEQTVTLSYTICWFCRLPYGGMLGFSWHVCSCLII